MSKSKILSSLAAVVLAGCFCAAARADTIMVISGGSASETGSTITANETVYAVVAGEGPLSTLSYTLNTVPDGSGELDGTGIYTGTAGTLLFSFGLPNSSFVSGGSIAGTSEALDGTFVFTGGTGSYAGAVGSGTLDVNYLITDTSLATAFHSGTLLSGSVTLETANTAVPLPQPVYASAAILALLLPGQWIRRRPLEASRRA